MAGDKITEPFPISKVAENYLLFDVDVYSHTRRNYNICGLQIGTLPQVPQQSVYLGLPIQLMPEEARVLVEDGHAYIVDEAAAHKHTFLGGGLSKEEREAFQRAIDMQGKQAAMAVRKQAEERKEQALRKVSEKQRRKRQTSEETTASSVTLGGEDEDTSLFSAAAKERDDAASTTSAASSLPQIMPFALTPTTSYPPLAASKGRFTADLPPVSASSYPLFKHLHHEGYFMMPGLRFGCQYNVYRGDPLRFHSHFLAVGREWDEEFNILEIIGGGRLGTGVKKGFMIGGAVQDDEEDEGGDVRTFCFEWAGM